MGIKQKEAVINEVLVHLPTFNKGVDNALSLLSSRQLEIIKSTIYGSILTGAIEYSKDLSNTAEVKSYARSMVMNHLKKAKELTGGSSNSPNPTSSGTTISRVYRVKEKSAPKGVNLDLLPEELKAYAKSLI